MKNWKTWLKAAAVRAAKTSIYTQIYTSIRDWQTVTILV